MGCGAIQRDRTTLQFYCSRAAELFNVEFTALATLD